MVTVFTLSDHGAIKRRPRVLMRYRSQLPDCVDYELPSFSYSVRDGVLSRLLYYLSMVFHNFNLFLYLVFLSNFYLFVFLYAMITDLALNDSLLGTYFLNSASSTIFLTMDENYKH